MQWSPCLEVRTSTNENGRYMIKLNDSLNEYEQCMYIRCYKPGKQCLYTYKSYEQYVYIYMFKSCEQWTYTYKSFEQCFLFLYL